MADLSNDLTTILQSSDLENFQRINPERFGLRLDSSAYKSVDAVKKAIEHIYSEELKKNKKEAPYPATCLLAYVDPTGMVPAMGKYCRAADARPIIKVIARPHGLFSDLPIPCITNEATLKEEADYINRMIYAMHPVFYGDGGMALPQPGDEIEVDFEDQKNMVFGKYLGIIKSGVGFTRDKCEVAKDLFGDSGKTATPVGNGEE